MHEKDAHLAAGPVTVAPKRQQAVVLLPVSIATGVEWGRGDQYVDYGGGGEGKAAVVKSSVLFRPPPTHTHTPPTHQLLCHLSQTTSHSTETGPITAQQGESHAVQLSRSAAKAKAKT